METYKQKYLQLKRDQAVERYWKSAYHNLNEAHNKLLDLLAATARKDFEFAERLWSEYLQLYHKGN